MPKGIIIGADPMGLRTAYELLTKTGITPIILEKTGEVGGRRNMHNSFRRLIRRYFKPSNGEIVSKELAEKIEQLGGKIYLHQQIYEIYCVGNQVCSLHAVNTRTGELHLFEADYLFSSKPRHDLVECAWPISNRISNCFLLKQVRASKLKMISSVSETGNPVT